MLSEHKNKIAELAIIPAGSGVFEISMDDKLIFSKMALGRFPDDGEAEELIRNNL